MDGEWIFLEEWHHCLKLIKILSDKQQLIQIKSLSTFPVYDPAVTALGRGANGIVSPFREEYFDWYPLFDKKCSSNHDKSTFLFTSDGM